MTSPTGRDGSAAKAATPALALIDFATTYRAYDTLTDADYRAVPLFEDLIL